jgi:hypothetical protein
VRHSKKFGITVATASAALVAALAPAAQATDLSVCNQRENSHHASGLVPMGPKADPKGRGDATIGSSKAKGLLRAADNSPALTTCGRPADGGTTNTGGGTNDDGGTNDGGGGDDGWIGIT